VRRQWAEIFCSIVVIIIVLSIFLLMSSPEIVVADSVKISLVGDRYYFKPMSLEEQSEGQSEVKYVQYSDRSSLNSMRDSAVWSDANYLYRKEMNVTSVTNQTKYSLPQVSKLNHRIVN
jgi:hypothetical protein